MYIYVNSDTLEVTIVFIVVIIITCYCFLNNSELKILFMYYLSLNTFALYFI